MEGYTLIRVTSKSIFITRSEAKIIISELGYGKRALKNVLGRRLGCKTAVFSYRFILQSEEQKFNSISIQYEKLNIVEIKT